MGETKRSLKAALFSTPEAAQFIRGTIRTAESRQGNEHEVKSASTTAAAESQNKAAPPKARRQRPSRVPQPVAVERHSVRAKVAITTRFSQETAEALRKSSLNRKLRNEPLHTQQDIIELAVSNWLQSNQDVKSRGGDS